MPKKYLYEKVLICASKCLNLNQHLLENPILLPCGCSICKRCLFGISNSNEIYDQLVVKLFKCPFSDCNREYVILNVNKLPPSAYLIDLFMKNLKHIANDVVIKKKLLFKPILEKRDTYCQLLDSYFDTNEFAIEIHIESLKVELSKIELKFVEKLNKAEKLISSKWKLLYEEINEAVKNKLYILEHANKLMLKCIKYENAYKQLLNTRLYIDCTKNIHIENIGVFNWHMTSRSFKIVPGKRIPINVDTELEIRFSFKVNSDPFYYIYFVGNNTWVCDQDNTRYTEVLRDKDKIIISSNNNQRLLELSSFKSSENVDFIDGEWDSVWKCMNSNFYFYKKSQRIWLRFDGNNYDELLEHSQFLSSVIVYNNQNTNIYRRINNESLNSGVTPNISDSLIYHGKWIHKMPNLNIDKINQIEWNNEKNFCFRVIGVNSSYFIYYTENGLWVSSDNYKQYKELKRTKEFVILEQQQFDNDDIKVKYIGLSSIRQFYKTEFIDVIWLNGNWDCVWKQEHENVFFYRKANTFWIYSKNGHIETIVEEYKCLNDSVILFEPKKCFYFKLTDKHFIGGENANQLCNIYCNGKWLCVNNKYCYNKELNLDNEYRFSFKICSTPSYFISYSGDNCWISSSSNELYKEILRDSDGIIISSSIMIENYQKNWIDGHWDSVWKRENNDTFIYRKNLNIWIEFAQGRVYSEANECKQFDDETILFNAINRNFYFKLNKEGYFFGKTIDTVNKAHCRGTWIHFKN